MNCKILIRMTSFIFLFTLLFIAANSFMLPNWNDWDNSDRLNGFYKEPENKIEVLMIGSSVIANSMIPMELYEKYGICSYNLGTAQQPVMVSYYWLLEAYKRHPKTLKTVIMDASIIRYEPPLEYYRGAVDSMKFSQLKYQAVTDYTVNGGFQKTMSYFVPLFSYHSRWKSLGKEDFYEKYDKTANIKKGYQFEVDRYYDEDDYDRLPVPLYYADRDAETEELNSEGLEYLKKIADFCQEKGLKFILIKTPVLIQWNVSEHNAVQSVADTYGIDFLDFNFAPLCDEIEYNGAMDSADGLHMNYYGAQKITEWIGNYLVTECGVSDVRKNEDYHYLDSQLEQFHTDVTDIMRLQEITDPAEYLAEASVLPDCTVFVTVNDEAANSMTEEQREKFAALGLPLLSKLEFRDSYLAVVDRGEVIYEMSGHEKASVHESEEEPEQTEPAKELTESIAWQNTLDNGIFCSLESAGYYQGNTASCRIDGIEYAQEERGLQCVVYNNRTNRVVHTAYFDTHLFSEREPWDLRSALRDAIDSDQNYMELPDDQLKLYLYNRRCDNARFAAQLRQDADHEEFLSFLQAYQEKEDTAVFLAVKGDASGLLDEEAKEMLRQYGLLEYAEMEDGASYVAVIENGKAVLERSGGEQRPIFHNGGYYMLQSGGKGTEDCGYISINGIKYTASEGIQIVIYDMVSKTVQNRALLGQDAVFEMLEL